MKKLMKVLVVTSLLLGMVSGVQATNYTVADGNSSFTLDADSSAGMHTWLVDGTDQMFQQWFWYRIGNTGPESAINTLSAPIVAQAGRTLDVTYTGTNGIMVDVLYTLTGGTANSGQSDIAETIRIRNTGNTALEFHFFQYSDFDLDATIGNQTVAIRGGNTVDQYGPGTLLSETVVTPPPSFYEANTYANTLNSLNDGSPTTLNNVAGPITGDATWAFQWDTSLAAGGSFLISKDKNIRPVPEPVSMLLLGVGLVGVGLMRRKLA